MEESGRDPIQDKTNNNHELNTLIEEWTKLKYDNSQLSELINEVRSNDRYLQHHGAIGIKKLLSQKQIPITEVVDSGIVPRFIEFMENDEEILLQAEATMVVTKLLFWAEEEMEAIIDLGVLSVLIKLLKSPLPDILKEIVSTLGYVAAYSTIYRDMVLNDGGLELLIHILATTEDPAIIKDTRYAISKLCQGEPKPDLQIVSQAIPIICSVIKQETDPDVLMDALMALTILSQAINQIQAVIATGVVPSLIEHLGYIGKINQPNPFSMKKISDEQIVSECLKVLGNIINGDEAQTEFVISFPDFLPQLFKLAESNHWFLRRSSCWIVSNITAGTPDQINIIMENPEYVRILINIATNEKDPEVQKEAVWSLSNATACDDNPTQLPQATKLELFDCLARHLSSNDASLPPVALEGIENMLDSGLVGAGSGKNEFVTRLEENGGLNKLEGLQTHPDNEVSSKACEILEKFFKLEKAI